MHIFYSFCLGRTGCTAVLAPSKKSWQNGRFLTVEKFLFIYIKIFLLNIFQCATSLYNKLLIFRQSFNFNFLKIKEAKVGVVSWENEGIALKGTV
jgi:hypothetical protein